MPRSRHKPLSPVLTDEPIIGQGLTRRLRVVLISVVITVVLTNLTSYLIGQAVRTETERNTRARLEALNREFAADLEERRKARDAEAARQDASLQQLRRDACTLADRIVPRDAAVQALRQRYGCTGDARPSPGPTGEPATNRPGRPAGTQGGGSPDAPPAPGAPQPPRPAPNPPPAPAPPSPDPTRPPTPPEDDGLICLPLLGCVL
ncbi:hypothetical protein [Micromonospora sp. NPDC047730]|uniref:hypothetical protein n=1 Tax=Micromonospora sp. NPDC047730 TaxID=3364253 RepID=UPI003719ABEC